MKLLFTTQTGEVIEMEESDYISPIINADLPPSPATLSTQLTINPQTQILSLRNRPSTPQQSFSDPQSSSPKPIIILTDTNHLLASPNMAQVSGSPSPPPAKPAKVEKIRSISRTPPGRDVANPALWMVYNDYGELVTLEEKDKQPIAEELTVTQALRLVYKVYHTEFKDKFREILSPLLEGKIPTLVESNDSDPITDVKYFKDKVSSWIFSPSPDPSSQIEKNVAMTPEEQKEKALHTVPVYCGPPRVLDIGCADGKWCHRIKREHPEWIVEGVDDVDMWSISWDGPPPRDFMEPVQGGNAEDYFRNVHRFQLAPEFTCRNINQLLSHESPIPQNLYNLIRGRDIFDRVESYKNFLEDIRHLLQPSGVVEFIEIDPRPRCNHVVRRHSFSEHRSGAETDWTDRIADRFKDPYDAQLATTTQGWTNRVAERLKASLRPHDGVPAAKLKGWLQGAGFWDVKQVVIRLPIGGPTASGQKLRALMIQEISIENSMPILATKLPEIDLNDLNFGNFYLNAHIVTARKPKFPRPGDLLMDGTRQEMTEFKYEKMVGKTGETKNGVLVGDLVDVVENGSGWKRSIELDLHSSDRSASFRSLREGMKRGGEVGLGIVAELEE